MKLTILGCGEAFDDQLGNNACALSGKGVPTVLFDCGYQIPERFWRAKLELDGIYFTHLHADHCFGFVPLVVRYGEEKRRKPLRVIGPPGTERFLMKLLEMGYPGFSKRIQFDLRFDEVRAGNELSWGKLKLGFARSMHSVMNLAVRVDIKGGRSFGVSGDGNITRETQSLFRDVGILLQEVYMQSPGIPVHTDLDTFAEYVGRSGIKRVGVTHVSRFARKEVEKSVLRLAKKDPRWFMLRPSMEIPLI